MKKVNETLRELKERKNPCSYVEKRLRKAGFAVARSKKENLMAKLKPASDGPTIAFAGDFSKSAGIASAICAIENFLQKSPEFTGNIAFYSKQYFDADFAIVLDPTDLSVSNIQSGNLWLRFDLRDYENHSAIDKSILLIEKIRRVVKRFKSRIIAPGIRTTSIKGGEERRCNFVVDIRIPPKHEKDDYINEIIKLVKRFEAQQKMSIRVSSYAGGGVEPVYVEEDNGYLKRLAWHAKGGLVTLEHPTKAGMVSSSGIDAVCFGPAKEAQVEEACTILYLFLQDVFR